MDVIRRYKPEDCTKIMQVFYDTVHNVSCKDYTLEQLNAWAPCKLDYDKWNLSLLDNYTLVVERDGDIVGFGDLDCTGYLDRLYTHKDFQGQGIATQIINELEAYARKKDIMLISTAASITAKPFFEKRGYQVIKEQRVGREGQVLPNFIMQKKLQSSHEERLSRQIQFIVEIDKLKQIMRQSRLIDSDRNENDAEHSWHLAIMAILLSEYAETKELDVLKVVKMVLIHDLVEIDAGDTFCYDELANVDKAERENRAAKRIFTILPQEQAQEIWQLWREFEEMNTPEARFGACLDRLEPLLLNYHSDGHTWKKPGVTSEMVKKRSTVMKQGAPLLWEYTQKLIEDSIQRGILKR